MDIFNKELEVPYNFDKNLITGLSFLDPEGKHIHSIYTAPYRPDYRSAKYDYTHGTTGLVIADSQEMSREEYESHIAYINEKFPKKSMLLLQRTEESSVMSKEMLLYYFKLGFRKFCVGSIAQAKAILEINPFCELTASISMKLSLQELQENQELKKYFKNVVLWFPYNRDLETIQKLPNYFKYVLLVNCTCSTKCDGTHHWFADKSGEENNCCPNTTYGTPWTQLYIRPTDIPVFMNDITYLKLQGREYKTQEVLEDFVLYTTNKLIDPAMPVDENLYRYKTEANLAKLELEYKQGIFNTYREYKKINAEDLNEGTN